jgi:DNA-binding PadR family transcriptional regulator
LADIENDQAVAAAGGDAMRLFAVLVLLKERPGHGYQLADRLTDLGVDPRLGRSLYRVLRDMESRELVTSAWDLSETGGPPRRVYTTTEAGDAYLADATDGLIRQRVVLGQLLDRYRILTEADRRARPHKR